jgi:energy-coupling factor transporter ATP-binding protein EcfA2
MTLFGKVLVLLNLVFSFLLAGWSFALYANRIDWANTKEGEYTVRDTELKALWQGVRPAEASWRSARARIEAQEAQRITERRWYVAQMEHARSQADGNNPVQAVVFADRDDPALGVRKGQVMLDAKNGGRPLMAPAKDRAGQPLLSMAAYDREGEKIEQAMVVVLQKHEDQIKEDTVLTERLLGPKGLHQRLLAEKGKRERVAEEITLTRPQLINTVVESELILKRERQMRARIEELKKTDVATRE